MPGCILAFLGGQVLSAWTTVHSPAAAAACAGLVLGASVGPARGATLLRWLAAAVLGLWLAGRATLPPEGCFLPGEAGSEKQWIEGAVRDAAVTAPDRSVVAARAAVVRGPERQAVCGTLLLTLVGEGAFPEAGERFRVHAHLRRPRNFANPGAEDRAGGLARRGIHVTAFAKWTDESRTGREPPSLAGSLARERTVIAARIDRVVPAREGALLRALVLGDASAISDESRQALVDSGLAHLLAVSGLHVGAVWGAVFGLLHAALSRSEALLLRMHVRAVAAALALGPAALYGALAGGRAPTERAVLMTALFALALSAGREVSPVRVTVLAAGALAAAHPGAPLDVSWQLSFAAVAGIVLGLARARGSHVEEPSRLRRTAGVAVGVPALAFFATAPLTAWHFGRIAPVGLLTNPLAVPLAGIPATLLGLAAAALGFVSEDASAATLRLAAVPASWLLTAAEEAASLPFASLRTPTPTGLELGLAYALLSLPAWPPGRRRAVGAALFLVAAFDAGYWIHERLLHTDLRVRFLDVGQGDAAVIELPRGRVLVVDGGGFARSRFDVGERVVGRHLRRRRILRVDVLAVTHGDWDHQGGLHALAREHAPRELWRSSDPRDARRLRGLEDAVRSSGGRVRVLEPGLVWSRDGVTIEALHPARRGAAESANDASLVLRLVYGRTSLLLTGDLEAGGEAELLSRALAPAGLVKVPHHGSRSSSTPAFLERLRPRVAVVSVGAGNRYGLPHGEILARYRRRGARVLRTDVDGSVLVSSDGRRLRVRPLAESSPVACDLLGILC